MINDNIQPNNHAKVFREKQIEDFITQMEKASMFAGPEGEQYRDNYIELVLEEVRNNETDLSEARVAIELYVLAELRKNPSNAMFQRLSDAIAPIIRDTIAIEVKMHGMPKYVVSTSAEKATAWRTDGASQSPIQNISLPVDVAQEIQKYGFTHVQANEAPTLAEPEETIVDLRVSFFKAIEPEENVDSEDIEKEWLNNFKEEAIFEFIDKAIDAANQYEQISMLQVDQLVEYCDEGVVLGKYLRNDAALEYELECDVPEAELSPDEFLITARNTSLRALFTLFQITKKDNTSLMDVIEAREKDESALDHLSNEEIRSSCIRSLAKVYAKHPIFTLDIKFIELIFKAIDVELLSHFYVAMNDLASYYEERNFHSSAKNCYLMKEMLSDMDTSVEVEEVIEELIEAKVEVQQETQRVIIDNVNEFIED